MAEFGLARLEPLADEIIGRTERAMRESLRRLKPRRLHVRDRLRRVRGADRHPRALRGAGDELWVDYTGTSPESRRGINVVMNYTEAYTTYGVKVIVSPDVPNNEGAFRPLRITAPEGIDLERPPPRARSPRATSSATSCPTRWPARSRMRCPGA